MLDFILHKEYFSSLGKSGSFLWPVFQDFPGEFIALRTFKGKNISYRNSKIFYDFGDYYILNYREGGREMNLVMGKGSQA